MNTPIFEITKSATFDAAHDFEDGPPQWPYSRLYGHSFKAEATVRGAAQAPVGWIVL